MYSYTSFKKVHEALTIRVKDTINAKQFIQKNVSKPKKIRGGILKQKGELNEQ
jgi:hypothetical protein